jgi:hypothetical protein
MRAKLDLPIDQDFKDWLSVSDSQDDASSEFTDGGHSCAQG